MSFGFQLFDENGELALDDKSFSIIGRDVVLSGVGSFPLYPEFFALGVSGAQLVGKGFHWYISQDYAYVRYEVIGGQTLTAVVFEDSSKSDAYPIMGIEIFSESGLKTFSGGDRHFEIISTLSTRSDIGITHNEPLDMDVIYILHSLASYVVGTIPLGAQLFGAQIGVDYLEATSTTLSLGQYRTWQIPNPDWALYRPRPQYTSQLLRVRAK